MQLHLFIKVGFVSAAIVLILFVILRLKKLWRGKVTFKGPLKTMIVLGSGKLILKTNNINSTDDCQSIDPKFQIILMLFNSY